MISTDLVSAESLICLWLLVGYFNVPDGIVLSVPVTFRDGKWSVLFDVTVGHKLKERLQLSATELTQVCHKDDDVAQHTVS